MADGFDTEFSELYAHIVESDLPMHQKLTDAIVTLGLPAGSVVVSIGDGTGEPGVRIAKAQPDLKVFSTDASAQMTSMAAEYGAGVENVATVTVSGDDDDLVAPFGHPTSRRRPPPMPLMPILGVDPPLPLTPFNGDLSSGRTEGLPDQ